MALTFQSTTLSSSSAVATACPCAYPTSTAAGDILVCIVGTKPFNAVIDPLPGWLPLGQFANGSTAQGFNTGSVLIAAYVKEANGTESGNLTVGIPAANASYVALYRYTKAAGQAFSYAAVFVADITANTTWSNSFATDPGIASGDHIILGGVVSTQTAGTWTGASFSAASATFTGIVSAGDNNPRVTTGNGLGGNTNHCSCTAGPATGAPSWASSINVSTNMTGSGVAVRIREISPGTPTAAYAAGAWQ